MKSSKLYLTIVSIIALLASNAIAAAWTGSTSEPENMKKIDGKPFYVITTADELAWFAAQVNAGLSTINAVLGNDIVFGVDENTTGTVQWIPIGKDDSYKFNGIFDGANHAVYGVYTEALSLSGFFGVLGKEGTIKNLITKVGRIGNEKNFNGPSLRQAGGIVARNEGTIMNVSNGNKVVGGTTSDTSFAGGITARNEGSIINSSNNATISSNSVRRAVVTGGVAAFNLGLIVNTGNSGNIYANGDNTDDPAAAGGIAGYNYGDINRTRNSGMVFSRGGFKCCSSNQTTYHDSYSGGVVAINKSTLINSINSGNIVSESYDGKMTSKQHVNGIIASGKATNSIDLQSLKYWLNKTEVQGTAENMQKDQFAWILNTTNGTETNSSVWSRNGGYPIFADESNHAIYKVIFNDDGATSNRYTNNKGLVSFPENPEPAEGFVFTGWYNANDVRVKPTTVFTADQTINAVYVDASEVFWTINFFNTDSKTTLLQTKQYQHGSIVSYEGDVPTKETTAQYTYTFKGWDVEPTNAVEDFDYHAVYDSTLRSYKITFNNYDGSKIENGTFEYGTTPSCSKTPTRTSTVEWTYSHKGWRPAIDVVTGDAAYTAIYDSAKVKYKVTFMNGTAVINEQMVAYGDAAIAPTNVVREGYKFVGWNTSYAKVTEELVVKALFEELIIRKISVIDESGKNIENTEVGDGEKYILPEAPAKEGYSFDGWYNGNTKLGIAGDEITVIADITITAKYTVKSFVIVFVNESDTLQKTSVKYGETPVYTGKTPSKPSTAQYTYTFANWTPSITTVKGDATYKATFIGVLNLYKVTFLDFDGSVLKSQEVKYGSAATVPIEPQRDGYKFLGWDKNFDKVVSNLEVTALFEKNSSSSSTMSSSSEVVSSSSREESSSSDGGEALEFAPIIPQFSVQVFARNVQIAGAKTGSYYAVFDMQGRVIVASQKVVAANFNFALPQSGNYLIKIGSQVRKINVK